MSVTNSNGSFVISSYTPQLDAGRGDWNLPVARTQRKPHPRTEVLGGCRWRGVVSSFDGLDGAAWRFEAENAASVRRRFGSTGDAIAAMRTAGLTAANGGGGERRGRRGRRIALPTRGGSITATSSARTGRGTWGIKVPET
jgi:hypothetical protein